VRYNIAQLYAQLQQWQEAIDWLNRWLLYTENPDPAGFYLMGIAYFQLEDFDAAIAQAKRSVEYRPNPKEPWIRLLAALYGLLVLHVAGALKHRIMDRVDVLRRMLPARDP
jgi:cytochrome b561